MVARRTQCGRIRTFGVAYSLPSDLQTKDTVSRGWGWGFSNVPNEGIHSDGRLEIPERPLSSGYSDEDPIEDGDEEGAIAELVKCFSSLHLQGSAVETIANLADAEDDSINAKIANGNGVLAGLVKCLSITEMQEPIAGALGNLSAGQDTYIKRKIGNEDGILSELAKCLSTDKRDSQDLTAWALANLATGEDISKKQTIANEDGVLGGHLKGLSVVDKPGLQEQAVEALANLAGATDDSVKQRVGKENGVLARGYLSTWNERDDYPWDWWEVTCT